jgi:hypothetical protein
MSELSSHKKENTALATSDGVFGLSNGRVGGSNTDDSLAASVPVMGTDDRAVPALTTFT